MEKFKFTLELQNALGSNLPTEAVKVICHPGWVDQRPEIDLFLLLLLPDNEAISNIVNRRSLCVLRGLDYR